MAVYRSCDSDILFYLIQVPILQQELFGPLISYTLKKMIKSVILF
jgi:hypothetical protein